MDSLPPKRRHLGCRLVLLVMGLLIVISLVVFVKKTVEYYHAFRSGKTSSLLDRELSSSVSRMKANPDVSEADLQRLVVPTSPSRGPANAKLTIVEFLDFGCPYCRALMPDLRLMQQKYPKDVRIVYRDFPIEELHPSAMNAAYAARCAQAQNKYFEYHDKLFLNQERQSLEDLKAYAVEIGLDSTAFNNCLEDRQPEALIRQDINDGLLVGVSGTPTLFFNRIRIQGAPDQETLDYLIKEFLKDDVATSTKK